MDHSIKNYIYVEPNNTGTTSDDLSIHDQAARQLAESQYANDLARRLKCPLLIPVFPRPENNWATYTHYLDRDSMLIEDGPLKRIDLQLIAMVEDVKGIFQHNQIDTHDKILMHGFSASSGFSLRFAAMHPKRVKAVAAGGVNALPIFPVSKWQGTNLRYPIGIDDLPQISGSPFNQSEYLKVAHFIYMGYLDKNDTMTYSDAWDDTDRETIKNVFGSKMMPERWNLAKAIFASVGSPAQLVTYDGTGHEIRREMKDDLARFFLSNLNEQITTIQPFSYPFVEQQELKEVRVSKALWKGDSAIPAFASDLGDAHFILSIGDWIQGQNHRQLYDFVDLAGFNFLLTAPGHSKIAIDSTNMAGSFSDGSGGFQGYLVQLSNDQLNSIAAGVSYSLEVKNNNSGYVWKLPTPVNVVRP